MAPTTTEPASGSTIAAASTVAVAPSTTVAVVAPPLQSAPAPTVPKPTAPAPTAPPLAAGNLVLSTSRVDFGTSSTVGGVTLTNTGGRPLDWSIGGLGAPFGGSPAAGTLAPGASVGVQLTFDNASVPEGPIARDVSIVSSGSGGGGVALVAVVDRSPRVSIVQGAPNPTCPPIAVPTIVAAVTDASIASVVLSWSGPGGAGSAVMQNTGNWSAPLGVDYVDGTWSYVVTATDTAGNSGSAGGSTVVQCPTPG